MSGTYISYATDDAVVAAKVAAYLVQSGAELTNDITECDAVTLIFGSAAAASPVVRGEAAYAIWKHLPITSTSAGPVSLDDFLFLLDTNEMTLPEDMASSSVPPPANVLNPALSDEDITDMFFTATELIGDNAGQAVYLIRHVAQIAPNFADGQIEHFSRRIVDDHHEYWLEALVERSIIAIGNCDWPKTDAIIGDIGILCSMRNQAQNLEDRFHSAQLSQLLPQAMAAIDEDRRDTAQWIADVMLAIDPTYTNAQEILAIVTRRNESDALYMLASVARSQGREQATLQLVYQANRIIPDYGDPDELIRNQVIGVATGKLIKQIITLSGHEYAVNTLAFTPDGTLMASGSRDNTICLWEMPEGRQVAILRRNDGAVRSLVFSPDGSHMASLSGSVIRVWAMPEGHEVVVFDASNRFDNVASLAFSPTGDGLICGHVNGQISWVRIADGQQIMSSRPHDRSVQALALSSSGERLASCAGNLAKTWRVLENTLSPVVTFEEERLISAACLSPDETMLAIIASFEAKTRSLANGDLLFSCEHDENTLLNAIAFSADNSILVTGASDGTIKLWAIPDGRLINTLAGERTLNALVFSPDGSLLATATTGGEIRLWGLPQRRD